MRNLYEKVMARFSKRLQLTLIDQPENKGMRVLIRVPKNKKVIRNGVPLEINEGYVATFIINCLLGYVSDLKAKHKSGTLYNFCADLERAMAELNAKYESQGAEEKPKSPIITPNK